ncbi:MAG: ribonuclease, partial [Actinomycetota bacterium]|nr:ribonuclease [Actinomycetota bacterium]
GIGEQHQLEQLIYRTVSRWAFKKYRRNPVIIPIVIDA